jgi:hypothetical protein
MRYSKEPKAVGLTHIKTLSLRPEDIPVSAVGVEELALGSVAIEDPPLKIRLPPLEDE